MFAGQFWKDYPYFLPCLATAGITAISFVITLVWFKEVRLSH